MTSPPAADPPADRDLAAVVPAGDPVLRNPSATVGNTLDPAALTALQLDMSRALRRAGGVGLAAAQIGVALRVIVLADRAVVPDDVPANTFSLRERNPFLEYTVVDPTFTPNETLGGATWFEACLSVPDYTAAVTRWRGGLLEGRTIDDRPLRKTVTGWEARIVQHEIDHLNGVLYLDRMIIRTFMARAAYLKRWRLHDVADVIAALGATEGTPTFI